MSFLNSPQGTWVSRPAPSPESLSAEQAPLCSMQPSAMRACSESADKSADPDHTSMAAAVWQCNLSYRIWQCVKPKGDQGGLLTSWMTLWLFSLLRLAMKPTYSSSARTLTSIGPTPADIRLQSCKTHPACITLFQKLLKIIRLHRRPLHLAIGSSRSLLQMSCWC